MERSTAPTISSQSTPSSSSSPFSEAWRTPPPSVTRLWRPAAQRNLRNQWPNLVAHRKQWASLSSTALSYATSLVNSFLSQRYMKAMDLGVLSDMPNIRTKACQKLFKQQVLDIVYMYIFGTYCMLRHAILIVHKITTLECWTLPTEELHRSKLLSTYKNMVAVVIQMVVTGTSMRSFHKGSSNSPLVQFSSSSDNGDDNGDGGGIPVFTFWSISSFEKLAQELIQMYVLELNLKRLLVTELLSISSEVVQPIQALCWSNELYPGEFDDLSKCNLYSTEACGPTLPILEGCKSDFPLIHSNHQPGSDVLQVYLTTWLAAVNIDKYRVDEIFAVVGEEMKVSFS